MGKLEETYISDKDNQMDSEAFFIVLGEPVAKGRPRFTRTGKAYTPKKTKDYEKKVRETYEKGGYPYFGRSPVRMEVKVFMAAPKSTSKKKLQMMKNGFIRPIKKPDLTNIVKSIEDGLNGVAYEDDSQIVEMNAEKYYSEIPHVSVLIFSLENE